MKTLAAIWTAPQPRTGLSRLEIASLLVRGALGCAWGAVAIGFIGFMQWKLFVAFAAVNW